MLTFDEHHLKVGVGIGQTSRRNTSFITMSVRSCAEDACRAFTCGPSTKDAKSTGVQRGEKGATYPQTMTSTS